MFTPASYHTTMTGGTFITRPLSLWLDLVRALAAVAVVIGHSVQIGVYSGPFPFTIALQLNAVVVFFVLSGLVIAASAPSHGRGLPAYAAARVARIVPVALAALAISHIAALWCASRGLPPEPIGMDSGDINPARTLMAALFLTESLSTGLAINPPFWSLCAEVWFYALFGAALYLDGRRRIIGLAALALIAGANVLLLLPAWLAGVWLARTPPQTRLTPQQARLRIFAGLAALLVAGPAAPMGEKVLRALTWWDLGHAHYALSYFGLAIAFAFGLTGLRALLGDGETCLTRFAVPIRWTANMSFSLYLLHWPLLNLLKAEGVTAGGNPLGYAAILAGVIAVCGLFASLTEHRRQPLRRALERMFAGQRTKTEQPA